MNYFAVFLLCTVAVPLVLSVPARSVRQSKSGADVEDPSSTESMEASGEDAELPRHEEGIEPDHEGRRHDRLKNHQGLHEGQRKLGRDHEKDDKLKKYEQRKREKKFFASTPDGAEEMAITVTYVGYNTTAAPTTAATEQGSVTPEVIIVTTTVAPTMEPLKSQDEGANSVTDETDNESSLIDLDLALLKNNEINKLVKNQLNSAAKQSGVLGQLEQLPVGGLPGAGGLTGGLGGLTAPLNSLTGGLGLPGVPGVGGVGNAANKASNVAENTQQQIKKILEIDVNKKSLIGI